MGDAKVLVARLGGGSALLGADDEADLEQVGLDDVFERISFLAECGSQSFAARRPAVVCVDQGVQERAVQLVEPEFVDPLEIECLVDDGRGESAGVL